MPAKPNPVAPRRPWLRRLGWLAFAALTLVFCLLVGWRAFEYSMRAKVRARIAEVAPRVLGAREKEKEKKKEAVARVPMEELELVGGAFSKDEAKREEFRRRMEELEQFRIINVWSRPEAIDFVDVLRRLGVDVPDGMTNEQAAAEFLRRAAGVKETLEMLRRDLERGLWQWDKDVALHPEKWKAYNDALSVFWQGIPVAATVAEAEWAGGNRTAGADTLSLMAAAQRQLQSRDPAMALLVGGGLVGSSGTLFAKGLVLAQWSDAQVAELMATMPPAPSVNDLQAALESQRQVLLDASSSPETLEWMRNVMRAPHWGKWNSLEDVAQSIAKTVISDAQLADALALGVADVDRKLALIDADAGTFANESQSPLANDIRENGNVLERAFLQPARALPGFGPDELANAFADGQREVQAAQYVAALELHRRHHGSYPETLDVLPAASGVSAPPRNASATETSYSLDAAGGYVLKIGRREIRPPAAKR